MAVPRLVEDARDDADATFNQDFLRQLVGNADLIFAALLELVVELNIALLMAAEEQALRLGDALIDVERYRDEDLVVEVVRRLNACDHAVSSLALSGAYAHVREGQLCRLKDDELQFHLADAQHVLTGLHGLIDGCELALLPRFEYSDLAVLLAAEEIDGMLTLVVEQMDDGFCHGRALVFSQCPDFDIAVVVQAAQLDIRKFDVRFIVCQMDGIDELRAAICLKAVEPVVKRLLRHVENAVIAASRSGDFREFAEQALVLTGRRVLGLRILRTALADVYRAGTDFRVDGDRLDVVVEMAAKHELCLAALRNRHNVAVVERVRVRVMHHEDAPLRLLSRRARQVFLNPLECIINALARLPVKRHLGIDGIHLEEAPGIAVDQREVRRAVIERECVAAVGRVDCAPLRRREERVVVRAVIVIAVDVVGRDAREDIGDLVEPVILILVVLITRTERNVTAVQDKFRRFLYGNFLEERTVVKEMRV